MVRAERYLIELLERGRERPHSAGLERTPRASRARRSLGVSVDPKRGCPWVKCGKSAHFWRGIPLDGS